MLTTKSATVMSAALTALAVFGGPAIAYSAANIGVSATVLVSDTCLFNDPEPTQTFTVTFVSDSGEVLADDRGANRFALPSGAVLKLNGVDMSDGVHMVIDPVEGYEVHLSEIRSVFGYSFNASIDYTGSRKKSIESDLMEGVILTRENADMTEQAEQDANQMPTAPTSEPHISYATRIPKEASLYVPQQVEQTDNELSPDGTGIVIVSHESVPVSDEVVNSDNMPKPSWSGELPVGEGEQIAYM